MERTLYTAGFRITPEFNREERYQKRKEITDYLDEKLGGVGIRSFAGLGVQSSKTDEGSDIKSEELKDVGDEVWYAHFIVTKVNAVFWGKVVMPMLEYWGKTWDVDIKVEIGGGVTDLIISVIDINISWNLPYRGLR